jgi:hypothetical protein
LEPASRRDDWIFIILANNGQQWPVVTVICGDLYCEGGARPIAECGDIMAAPARFWYRVSWLSFL